MSWTLVAKTSAGSSNGGASVTTSAINCVGADLIVVAVGFYNQVGTLSDSSSNSWTSIGPVEWATDSKSEIFYCFSPTTSASQTFTFTKVTGNIYPSITVLAYSGSKGSGSYDQTNNNTGGSVTTISTGSITPSVNGSLVIATVAVDVASVSSISVGTIEGNQSYASGQCLAEATMDYIQATAAAINPTWTLSQSGYAATIIVSFEPGTSTTPHGTLASTFNDFTLSGTGKALAKSALALTWADFTLTGTGKALGKAALALTWADFTLSATGKALAKAALASTFGDFTLAGTGHYGTVSHGTLAVTWADFTLAGTAKAPAKATLAATVSPFVLVATGKGLAKATLTSTFAAFTLVGTGHNTAALVAHGTLTTPTFGAFSLVGSGLGPPPPAVAPTAPLRPPNVPYSLGLPGGAPGSPLAMAMHFTRATVAMNAWVAQAANIINNLSTATTRSASNTTVAVPGSVTATSPTYKMLGLGYNVALAPYLGTNISLTVTGSASDATLSDLITLILAYGEGVAPLNGAALTGKQVGTAYTYTQLVASAQMGFNLTAILQGLVLSTSYWFDLAVGTSGGHTVSFGPVNISAFEL